MCQTFSKQLLYILELPTVDPYSVHDGHNMVDATKYLATQIIDGKQQVRRQILERLRDNDQLESWLDPNSTDGYSVTMKLKYKHIVTEFL